MTSAFLSLYFCISRHYFSKKKKFNVTEKCWHVSKESNILRNRQKHNEGFALKKINKIKSNKSAKVFRRTEADSQRPSEKLIS